MITWEAGLVSLMIRVAVEMVGDMLTDVGMVLELGFIRTGKGPLWRTQSYICNTNCIVFACSKNY